MSAHHHSQEHGRCIACGLQPAADGSYADPVCRMSESEQMDNIMTNLRDGWSPDFTTCGPDHLLAILEALRGEVEHWKKLADLSARLLSDAAVEAAARAHCGRKYDAGGGHGDTSWGQAFRYLERERARAAITAAIAQAMGET